MNLIDTAKHHCHNLFGLSFSEEWKHSSNPKKYKKKSKTYKNDTKKCYDEKNTWIEVKLSQRQTAMISDEDFKELDKYVWCVKKDKTNKSFYMKRTDYSNNKKKTVAFQNEVLTYHDFSAGKIDHFDRNGLNNKRENLRLLTDGENNVNRCMFSNNTSGSVGVSYHKQNDGWIARWQDKNGKHNSKYFSCKTHGGSENAKRLAIQYRADAISKIQKYNCLHR